MTPSTMRLLTWTGPLPEIGEYLRTAAGTVYAIIAVRPNLRSNPKSVARLDLIKFTRGEAAELPADIVAHPIYWTPRRSRGVQ